MFEVQYRILDAWIGNLSNLNSNYVKRYIVSERKRIDIIWNKASGPVISNEVFKLRFLIAIFHVVF